ncbi:MAG: copper chaperone PCu(A)C [Pseudomonadota bacterium]
MKPMSRLIIVSLLASSLGVVHAQTSGANGVVVENVWARATPAGAKTGAVYMTLINNGAIPDRLWRITTPAADSVQIHKVGEANGVSSMREIPTMDVAPGERVTFKPGDLHAMLVGLKQPLKQGQTIPLTFEFEKGGKVDVAASVAKVGAMHGGDMGAMNHSHDGPMKK